MLIPNNAVLSIRQVGCKKSYPYYAVGIYVPVARQRDAIVTYRLIGNYTNSSRSQRPQWYGVDEHPQYRDGIRHGTVVKDSS